MCRPTEKEVGPTIDIDISYSFRPSTDTGPSFLRLFRETAPFQSHFTTRMGIWRTYCRLTLQGPNGGAAPMSERTGGGGGPSPSLLNLVLFYFGGFGCFVLCLCFGSEYLLNPSDPPLHVIQNILYLISYILKFHAQFYKVDLFFISRNQRSSLRRSSSMHQNM